MKKYSLDDKLNAIPSNHLKKCPKCNAPREQWEFIDADSGGYDWNLYRCPCGQFLEDGWAE